MTFPWKLFPYVFFTFIPYIFPIAMYMTVPFFSQLFFMFFFSIKFHLNSFSSALLKTVNTFIFKGILVQDSKLWNVNKKIRDLSPMYKKLNPNETIARIKSIVKKCRSMNRLWWMCTYDKLFISILFSIYYRFVFIFSRWVSAGVLYRFCSASCELVKSNFANKVIQTNKLSWIKKKRDMI